MSEREYKSQKPQMARLAAREGWSDERFEETYHDFISRAKIEQDGQSLAYQVCRGEGWMWKVHFKCFAPFQGIEPRRDTKFAPHVLVHDGHDRYTPLINRHGRLARSRSPRRDRSSSYRDRDEEGSGPWAERETPRSTSSWAQTAMNMSTGPAQSTAQTLTPPIDEGAMSGVIGPSSSQNALGIVNSSPSQFDSGRMGEGSRLRPSVVIANTHIKDTRLFFPSSPSGLPRYSHILHQRNALRAFIGPKSLPNITYLEKHFPRLHFRKANLANGLLIWVEMPLELLSGRGGREAYRLSNFDRSMLESADKLLGAFAALRGDLLPDIDVFVKRYCDGRYDA